MQQPQMKARSWRFTWKLINRVEGMSIENASVNTLYLTLVFKELLRFFNR